MKFCFKTCVAMKFVDDDDDDDDNYNGVRTAASLRFCYEQSNQSASYSLASVSCLKYSS